MSEGRLQRPTGALARLQKLRVRRRSLRAYDSVLRLAIVVAALVWGSFLLDWFLELPWEIRLFHLVVGAAVTVFAARQLLTSRRSLDDELLAAQVEDAVGNLDQSLITAVQLTAPQNRHAAFYSRALIERCVREAEEKMTAVDPARLLSRRALATAGGLFVLLAVPLLLGAVLRHELVRTYFERDLLLRSVPWPRAYWFELVEPTTEQRIVAMGDPLTVQVRRVRGGDTRVRLEVRYAGGGERETFLLEKKGEDLYRRVFRNITRGFQFWIEGGDFRSSQYSIEVRHRPRIDKIELTFGYPAYTGLAKEGESPLNLGGHLKVPIGTVVDYHAHTSMPVKSAARIERYSEGGKEKAVRDDVTLTGERDISGKFVAEHNGTYEFALTSLDGFENSNPIRYRIAVIEDQAPTVQITKPGRNQEVSPHAVFPIDVEAQDDYGISSAKLVFHSASGDADAMQEKTIALDEVGGGTREGKATRQIDLEEWKPPAGSRIEYHAEAEDAIHQRGSSRVYILTVVRVEDLTRIIQDELAQARERIDETVRYQRDNRHEVEEVLDHTRIAGGTVPKDEGPNLRHARVSQEKILQRSKESVDQFQEIIDRIVTNRLNDVKELPWIQELHGKLSQATQGPTKDSVDALDEVARRAADGKASSDDLKGAIAHLQASEKALNDVLKELQEWGDMRTIIRKLEDVLRTQKDLQEKVEEKARDKVKKPQGALEQ